MHTQGNFSHVAGGASYFDRKPHDLRILLLDDEAWPKYYDDSFTKHGLGSLCQERTRMATWQQRITPGIKGGKLSAETSFTMQVRALNRISSQFDLHQIFFALFVVLASRSTEAVGGLKNSPLCSRQHEQFSRSSNPQQRAPSSSSLSLMFAFCRSLPS